MSSQPAGKTAQKNEKDRLAKERSEADAKLRREAEVRNMELKADLEREEAARSTTETIDKLRGMAGLPKSADDERALMGRLAEPFPLEEIKAKPQVVKGDQALATFFIDARIVMDRLDEVVGAVNWSDHYDVLPNGSVVCTLKINVYGTLVQKVDVGSPSEQPDEGDRMKAAFSDALKRAAVKFGIGRYIYRIPPSWFAYDAQKRKWVKRPVPPAWALPQVHDQNARLAGPATRPSKGATPSQQTPRVQAQAVAQANGVPTSAAPKPKLTNDQYVGKCNDALVDRKLSEDGTIIRYLREKFSVESFDGVRGDLLAAACKLYGETCTQTGSDSWYTDMSQATGDEDAVSQDEIF